MSSLFSGRLGSYVVLLHGSKEFIVVMKFYDIPKKLHTNHDYANCVLEKW